MQRAFGNSGFDNLRSGPSGSVSASSRPGSLIPARPRGTGPGSAAASRNSFGTGFASNRLGFRDFGRFGNFDRFGFRPRFPRFPFNDFDNDFDDFFPFLNPFFGCFGCGFGFGFGSFGFNFGFGAPLWWGATWPWWSGGYPYGPYGYGLPYDAGLIYNSPAYRGPQSDNPSASTYPRTPASTENASAILLYLKDGTMYSVRDCWLAAGELHCTAADGSERVFDLDAVDFQRTVDENAKRGVPFTLKPNSASSKPPY